MAKTIASAPGKVILFGEHAVVYGQPAIAIPVNRVRTTATVCDSPQSSQLLLPDLGKQHVVAPSADATDSNSPLITAIRLAQAQLELDTLPPLAITVSSSIPIASGLGSGAAAAAAIIRAVMMHCGAEPSAETLCALTYEVEKQFHGTPSGIDNTVVTYEQPVYFVRQQPANRIDTFSVAQPLTLLIADTGRRSETHAVVGDVRRQWLDAPDRFNTLFERCGEIANAARTAIATGKRFTLGTLMLENQLVLEQMTVSSPELERLVQAAMQAGALGAKLSGAGRGGNIIALVSAEAASQVIEALVEAGAVSVIETVLG